MSDLQFLLQQAIHRWRAENIPIRSGVDPTKVIDFEAREGVVLPSDLREYFLAVDGMGDHFDEEHFFRFWPLEQLREVKKLDPDVTNAFPQSLGYYYFFDHSIDLFLFAIRLTESPTLPTPIARVYPQSDGLDFQPYCDSFTEFLRVYVENPDDLY